ncbi:MAG: TetR/AcrR family transcriptional regulator [Chloroflexales bacterium]|nr:TetR/AcrR family transcriptional regulator [Chloroflexales bacterium]
MFLITMAKAFTDAEKQELRDRLLSIGREHFTTFGLKKTSLEDLTRAVGIAKSSFYLFFASKEALYWELMLIDGQAIHDRIYRASFHSTADMRSAIALFIRAVLQEIESNKLYQRLVDYPEELKAVLRTLSPDQKTAQIAGSIDSLRPYIIAGQRQGQIIAGRPEVIAAVIRTVTLFRLLRDAIGPDYFQDVLELFVTLVADGLTEERKEP